MVSAADLSALYEERGSEIFNRTLWHRLRSLGMLADSKYPPDGLERVLREFFRDEKLSDAETRVMVPAYEIRLRRAYFFKSWHPRYNQFALREVCRATSAAPTYFPVARVKDAAGEDYHFWDGGLLVNNPAICALAEARRLWPSEDIMLLSLGTGETRQPLYAEDVAHAGAVSLLGNIMETLFSGSSQISDYLCAQASATPRVAYYRLQPDLLPGQDSMDDCGARNLESLRAAACGVVESAKFEAALRALAN
jgi:hypothetical protein